MSVDGVVGRKSYSVKSPRLRPSPFRRRRFACSSSCTGVGRAETQGLLSPARALRELDVCCARFGVEYRRSDHASRRAIFVWVSLYQKKTASLDVYDDLVETNGLSSTRRSPLGGWEGASVGELRLTPSACDHLLPKLILRETSNLAPHPPDPGASRAWARFSREVLVQRWCCFSGALRR